MKFISLALMASLVFLMLVTDGEASLEESLVLYLNFDEKGGEFVKDLSPEGNDATIVGEPEWVEGRFNLAIEFVEKEGRSGIVNLPSEAARLLIEDDPSLDFNDQPFTITAWINLKSTSVGSSPDSYTLITNKKLGFADNHANYAIFINRMGAGDAKAGLIQFAIGDLEVCERIEFKKTISSNSWYHLAISFDPNTDKVNYYLDGSLEETADSHVEPAPDEESPVYIGAQPITNNRITRFFDGKIDDLAVFNKALTGKEINTVMISGPLSVNPSGNLATTWSNLKSW